MLFSNQRKHRVHLAMETTTGQPPDMAYLVRYICQHLMTDRRKELFVLDESVYATPPQGFYNKHCSHLRSRPGILVLINESDWELEGEEHYRLRNGDNILFVSTLHGG